MQRNAEFCRHGPNPGATFSRRAWVKKSGPLEGEDIATSHWEDARHWMSIYADLIEFKRGILDRVRRDVSKLPPVARRAAEADVLIIESQMQGISNGLSSGTGAFRT